MWCDRVISTKPERQRCAGGLEQEGFALMTKKRVPQCDECTADLVLGPAIMRQGMVFSLPKPYRHHDVIQRMAELGVQTPIGHGEDLQGFMTIYGFKDRRLTATLIGHEGFLTSEDMW